jgi:hypothetical protein
MDSLLREQSPVLLDSIRTLTFEDRPTVGKSSASSHVA